MTADRQSDPGGNESSQSSSRPGGNFRRRVASAAVLAPVGIAAAYLGGWLFIALCAMAAALMLWEWTSLVAGDPDPRLLVPGWLALFGAAVLIGQGAPGVAVGAVAAGAIAVGLIAAVWPTPLAARFGAPWAAGGVVYAGIALFGPTVLRSDHRLGFTALLFLFATVWSTDIFAYFSGRALRGPLLWPRLSPNKTWAGAAGGTIGGVAAAILVAYASGLGHLAVLGGLALLLSMLAQAGDLFESAVKRRFGAKDASGLIPGHGGVMDRLDGFLVAALAAALIGLFRAGTTAPAVGLLLW